MIDHKKYNKELAEELIELTKELRTIATQHPTSGDWVAVPSEDQHNADQNVEADTVEDWNERRATVAQLETRYFNIKKALDKFDTSTYGSCELCGEEIETDRLDANPAARTCKIHLEKERELAN